MRLRELKNNAYTFTEVMVVMAIIAIMMAVLVPRLAFQQKGAGLKSGATELLSALRTARRMAISEREYRVLALDLYSVPGEFVIMRPREITENETENDLNAPALVPVGEFRKLPDNIKILAVMNSPDWVRLDVTRTDDNDLDGAEDAHTTDLDIFNPQVRLGTSPPKHGNNNIVNPVFRLIKFWPTGTADAAMIYLWNITEGRTELPGPTEAQTESNLHVLGVPPGLNIYNPSTPEQDKYFDIQSESSPDDAYYNTIVVNPITGGVKLHDYAWGYGGSQWDRKKDGE